MEAKDEEEVEWKITLKDGHVIVEFLDDVIKVATIRLLLNLNNQQKTTTTFNRKPTENRTACKY